MVSGKRLFLRERNVGSIIAFSLQKIQREKNNFSQLVMTLTDNLGLNTNQPAHY